MNRVLGVFILVSALLHLVLVMIVPEFKFGIETKLQPVEVEIVPPKPKPVPRPAVKAQVKPATETAKAAAMPVPKPETPPSPVKNPFKAPEPTISKPEMDMPKVNVDTNYDIEIPDLKISDMNIDSGAKRDDKLTSEIQSARDSVSKSLAAAQAGRNSGTAARDDSSFFVLDSISNSKRGIAHTPPEPSFALTQNTKVSVRFKIDRQGNTYGIVLITRTDSKIERLAVEFVEKLKFSSVTYAGSDSAEITLYFKVR